MKSGSVKEKSRKDAPARAQKMESLSFLMLLWVIYAHSHGDIRTNDPHWFWLLTMRSGCGITFFYVASGFHTHETWKRKIWESEWDMLQFFVRRFTPAIIVVFLSNTFEAWMWPDTMSGSSWSDVMMSSLMMDRFLAPMSKMPVATPLWTMQVLAVFWACYPLTKLALQATEATFLVYKISKKMQNVFYGALCVLLLVFSAQQWNKILDTGSSYDLHRRSVLMTWPSFLFGMLSNHIQPRLPQTNHWLYIPDLSFLILFILLISAPCIEPCDIVVTGWTYHMIEGPISTLLFALALVGLYYRPSYNGWSPSRYLFDRLAGLAPPGVPFLMYCFQGVFYRFRKHDPVTMHPLLFMFCRLVSPLFMKINRSLNSHYHDQTNAIPHQISIPRHKIDPPTNRKDDDNGKQKADANYACGMTFTQFVILVVFLLCQIPVGYLVGSSLSRGIAAAEIRSISDPVAAMEPAAGSDLLDEGGNCIHIYKNADAQGEHLALETFDSLKNCQMWCQTKDDCTWAVWQDPAAFMVCPGCCYLKSGKARIIKNKTGWTVIWRECPTLT